jgi:hypothetical protein
MRAAPWTPERRIYDQATISQPMGKHKKEWKK